MKTIHNSDIRFEVNSRIVYVPSFTMRFYTVSKKEFFFNKTNEDVQEVEESGETKYYIDLDWSELKYLGKGVMNYQCTNDIDDPSFPDGEYNQLIEKTTDYFIDTFTVDPDMEESFVDMIENEVSARTEADAVISGAVDTEIARAQSAETALQEAIDAETSARTSADEAINNAITAETSARVLADEALSQAIVDEASARTAGDEALQTAIDNEASARTNADTTLQNNIDAEASARTQADEALQANIDAEASARTAADEALQTAIDNEASARTSADETLQTNIDAEASARTQADETLNNAITAETSARTAADEALSGAVDTKLQDYYLKSETSGKTEIQTALDGKSDTGHTHDERYYRKDETSGATELEAALNRKLDASAYTPTDLSNYYTKDETSGKSEIASALSAKLDVTAYTPTDLSNYYTKSETSGATELNTAFSGKQDTLIAGDNITISGNVISAAGGDLSNYYTKSEVDEMSEVAAQGINDLNTNKLDATAYTPTDLSNYYTKSETSGKTELSTALSAKQDTLVSGTNIKTINNESILGSGNITIQGGDGKAIEAGRGIAITTGETADTVSFNLPISAGTGTNSIICGEGTKASGTDSFAIGGNGVKASGASSFAGGSYSEAKQAFSMAFGRYCVTNNYGEVALGFFNKTNGSSSSAGNSSANTLFSVGNGTNSASNTRHNAFEIRQNGDIYITSGGTDIKLQDNLGGGGSSINVVQTAGTSSGDVMSQNAVTSALSEKVYIIDNDVSALTDFKVALKLGYDYTSDNISTFYLRRSVAKNGSGALAYITTTDTNYPSITINGSWNNNGITTIHSTNGITSKVRNGVAQITLTGGSLVTVDATSNGGGAFIYKQYSSGQTADVVEGAVYDALEELSNNKLDYFYNNETINGAKTFLWGNSKGKPIVFKQSNDDAKIGFTCQNSASTNNEIATFEFRPNTFTIDGVKHPLLYFGHYRSTNTANAGVPQTVIGFRQYDQINAAAYHMLAPLPEKAKTPFSLTTTFQDFYMPMGFKNGSTMVKANERGVVDLSSEFRGKADADDLGGLKLQQVTQAEYDAITNKDASTLYVIVN